MEVDPGHLVTALIGGAISGPITTQDEQCPAFSRDLNGINDDGPSYYLLLHCWRRTYSVIEAMIYPLDFLVSLS